MKKYSFLIVCMLCSLVAMSQKAVISFEEKTHDFGKVNEVDGKITHVFNFVNKGVSPLVVSRVQASCGCTTPVWTKEPIEPGKKGAITVTYNPIGRPGTFKKTITVYSNATDEQLVLTIHGEVIPNANGGNPAYPVVLGSLHAKSKVIQMNSIDKGKMQSRVLDIKTHQMLRLNQLSKIYLFICQSLQVRKFLNQMKKENLRLRSTQKTVRNGDQYPMTCMSF